MDPLGIGAVALGGALDFMGQNNAANAQAKALQKALKTLRMLQGEQGVAGGLALQQQQKGLADIQGGYQQGLAELGNAGRAATIGARDQAQQAFGGAQQDLITRGMLNPEHLAYTRMGISSGLARTLAGITTEVAARRAQLLTQQGLATAGQRGNIAGQIGQNFAGRADLATNAAQLRLDAAPQYQGGNMAALGQLAWLFGQGNKTEAAT